jgi:hypothetical protein
METDADSESDPPPEPGLPRREAYSGPSNV